MKTYVISDIHGQYDLFMEMLNKINLQSDDMLFVLGDMIDRGNKSLEVVEHIMNSKNMRCILGNHEEMLLYAIKNYGLTGPLGKNMVAGTNSYKVYMELRRLKYKSPDRVTKILNYLKNLPLHHTLQVKDKLYVLVHAGLRSDNLSDNTRDDMLWIREEFYEREEKFPYTVIFGHTPTAYLGECGKIWKKDDRIGIDCGAAFSDGRLACLRLDDMEEFYV